MQISGAAGDRQLGGGRSAGAQEVEEVRAAARLFPEDAIIGLDIKSAFGAVQWADALIAAVAKAPRLAVPMAVMWQSLSLVVWLRSVGDKWWHCFPILAVSPRAALKGIRGSA